MSRRNDKMPVILGMNPPSKEVLLFRSRISKSGYDCLIFHADFPAGTERNFKPPDDYEVDRRALACWLLFTDKEVMRMFGQMLVDFADRK